MLIGRISWHRIGGGRRALLGLVQQRWLSGPSEEPSSDELLLRDFIQSSLYHPVKGYFSSRAPPVGRLAQPIQFGRIVGEQEYKVVLSKLYAALGVSWLTPVEIFKPHYGEALAKYILEFHRHMQHPPLPSPSPSPKQLPPLLLYEVGGGTGTLAESVLGYIRSAAPDVYASTSYCCIEVSPSLAAVQRRNVSELAGHQGHFRVVEGNAWGPEAWGGEDRRHCFVLMMEVLDNLPHDRVVRAAAEAPWQQTVAVRGPGPGEWGEALRPLADPLLQRCLSLLDGAEASATARPAAAAPVGGVAAACARWAAGLQQHLLLWAGLAPGGSNADAGARFVPTASLSLLDALHALRPNHTLVAADFDALPDISVQGACAPLVSGRDPASGRSIDYDTVFVPWGSADIFFPTDFDALDKLYRGAAARRWAAGSCSSSGDGTGGGGASGSNGNGGSSGVKCSNSDRGGQGSGGRAVETRHVPSAAFFARFADLKRTLTLSGYNPLLRDYANTRIFFATSSAVRGTPSTGAAAAAKRRAARKRRDW